MDETQEPIKKKGPYPGWEKNLHPVTKGSLNARMLGRLGGKSKSISKSESAKWKHIQNRIKSGKMKVDDPEWFLQRCQDSKANRAQILADIEELKKMQIQPMTRVQLINSSIKLDERMHPNVQENININVDTTFESLRRRLLHSDEVIDVKAELKEDKNEERGD